MVIENSCICKFTNPPDVDNVIAVGLVTHLTEHKISIGFWGNLHLCEPNGKGVCAVSCLALLKTQGKPIKASRSFKKVHMWPLHEPVVEEIDLGYQGKEPAVEEERRRFIHD